jgi:hypothetical protein
MVSALLRHQDLCRYVKVGHIITILGHTSPYLAILRHTYLALNFSPHKTWTQTQDVQFFKLINTKNQYESIDFISLSIFL